MKKFAKIFLPVLAGLFVLFIASEIQRYSRPLNESQAEIDIWSFVGPILFILFSLIQWVIVLPIWNKTILKFHNILLSVIGIVLVFCMLSGLIVGYFFWQKQLGLHDLLMSTLIMTGIQQLYWVANILTLYYIDNTKTRTDIK